MKLQITGANVNETRKGGGPFVLLNNRPRTKTLTFKFEEDRVQDVIAQAQKHNTTTEGWVSHVWASKLSWNQRREAHVGFNYGPEGKYEVGQAYADTWAGVADGNYGSVSILLAIVKQDGTVVKSDTEN